MATLLLAAGLDPEACTLFVQSHVPAHTQLTWLLECTAGMGELRRMTQFKDKSARDGEESARVGLFTYPVLMAADILLYDADRVPVGDDQRQHLELTRVLAQRFNSRYGETFVVPEAVVPPPGRGDRIMDLQEPTKKMSKSSASPQGTIGLFDDPASIERKIKRAVTDTDTGPDAVRYDPVAKPGVSNLLEILAAVQGRRPEDVAGDYTQYGPLKADLAAGGHRSVEPIQAAYRQLAGGPGRGRQGAAPGARTSRRGRPSHPPPGVGRHGSGSARLSGGDCCAAGPAGERGSGSSITWSRFTLPTCGGIWTAAPAGTPTGPGIAWRCLRGSRPRPVRPAGGRMPDAIRSPTRPASRRPRSPRPLPGAPVVAYDDARGRSRPGCGGCCEAIGRPAAVLDGGIGSLAGVARGGRAGVAGGRARPSRPCGGVGPEWPSGRR